MLGGRDRLESLSSGRGDSAEHRQSALLREF
jgi:hypothetical protein